MVLTINELLTYCSFAGLAKKYPGKRIETSCVEGRCEVDGNATEEARTSGLTRKALMRPNKHAQSSGTPVMGGNGRKINHNAAQKPSLGWKCA